MHIITAVVIIQTLEQKRRRPWHIYLLKDKEENFYLKPFHCDVKLEWVCQITKGKFGFQLLLFLERASIAFSMVHCR